MALSFIRPSLAAATPRRRPYINAVGEADRRNTYLGIAPDGKIYAGMDSVTLLAETADVALEKLIEGIR
ncbi:hypothetical protein AB0933_06755 [Streptomyces venezuelae]|uniref:hypothetical protein n=1 Tax=Streptomyces venezuelae TaxID=54571 RepID=UPI003451B978